MVQKADYIFTFNAKDNVPDYVFNTSHAKVYGIGTKNYGACNGHIYRYRYSSEYFSQTTKPVAGYIELNNKWMDQWGAENYIDFLTPALQEDGSVRVFTDDHRYISQDGQHLTMGGARWYSKVIDLHSIFKK